MKKIKIIAIVILIGILGIGVLKYRNLSIDKSVAAEGLKKREVVVSIERIRKFSIDSMKKGDNMYVDESGEYFGKIKDIKVVDYEEELIKANGELVMAKVPEYYNLEITVAIDVRETDESYFIESGKELKVNSDTTFSTSKSKISGRVIKIGG